MTSYVCTLTIYSRTTEVKNLNTSAMKKAILKLELLPLDKPDDKLFNCGKMRNGLGNENQGKENIYTRKSEVLAI